MTEDALLKVKRSNLNIMRKELNVLRKDYEEAFKKWLEKAGEYVTETRVLWHKFQMCAVAYKELRFKLIENERKVEEK